MINQDHSCLERKREMPWLDKARLNLAPYIAKPRQTLI